MSNPNPNIGFEDQLRLLQAGDERAIAKWLDQDITDTGSGALLGSPAYMSPEQGVDCRAYWKSRRGEAHRFLP